MLIVQVMSSWMTCDPIRPNQDLSTLIRTWKGKATLSSLLHTATTAAWGRIVQEGVDEIAINDAFLLEMLVYRVLKRHFWMEPYYAEARMCFLSSVLCSSYLI